MSLQNFERGRDDVGVPLWVLWKWCGKDRGELGPQGRPPRSCLSETDGREGTYICSREELGGSSRRRPRPGRSSRSARLLQNAQRTGRSGRSVSPPRPCAPPGRHPSPFSHVTPSGAWHMVGAQSLFAECELVIVSKRPVRRWGAVTWSSGEGAGGAALLGRLGRHKLPARGEGRGSRWDMPRSGAGRTLGQGPAAAGLCFWETLDVGCGERPGVSLEACAELCCMLGPCWL